MTPDGEAREILAQLRDLMTRWDDLTPELREEIGAVAKEVYGMATHELLDRTTGWPPEEGGEA